MPMSLFTNKLEAENEEIYPISNATLKLHNVFQSKHGASYGGMKAMQDKRAGMMKHALFLNYVIHVFSRKP